VVFLLLGGAGFIGKNLCLHLATKGNQVIVFDRPDANYSGIDNISEVRIVKGLFDETSTFDDIFRNNTIDIVIHLISAIVPGDDLTSVITEVDNNLISTMKFMECMNRNGVKKMLYFSSGGTVYGNNGNEINCEDHTLVPINSYGWMKVVVEKYIQYYSYQNNFKYIVLRPSNPYGRFQNIYGKQGLVAVAIGKIMKSEPVEVWGDGSVVRDYIYIEDLCDAVYRLISSGRWNDIYNIGSGKAYSINQILKVIRDVSGIDFAIEYKDKRSVDIKKNLLCIDKLIKDTGKTEFIKAEEGILHTWEWINSNIRKV